MVRYTCNPSAQEVEARKSEVQGQAEVWGVGGGTQMVAENHREDQESKAGSADSQEICRLLTGPTKDNERITAQMRTESCHNR
jgi:hypothetical protein